MHCCFCCIVSKCDTHLENTFFMPNFLRKILWMYFQLVCLPSRNLTKFQFLVSSMTIFKTCLIFSRVTVSFSLHERSPSFLLSLVYTSVPNGSQTARKWFTNQMRVCVDGTANLCCTVCEWFAYRSLQTEIYRVFAQTQRELDAPSCTRRLRLWKINLSHAAYASHANGAEHKRCARVYIALEQPPLKSAYPWPIVVFDGAKFKEHFSSHCRACTVFFH